MTNCKNCKFQVSEKMKFALMKNICPSCGESLFSDKDANFINLIQSKLASMEFASNYKDETIYDISIFIFNELRDGFGKIYLEKFMEVKTDSYQENIEDEIRKEVVAEFSEQLDLLEDNLDETFNKYESSLDEKAERLKKIANSQKVIKNNNPISNSLAKRGQRVSRLD